MPSKFQRMHLTTCHWRALEAFNKNSMLATLNSMWHDESHGRVAFECQPITCHCGICTVVHPWRQSRKFMETGDVSPNPLASESFAEKIILCSEQAGLGESQGKVNLVKPSYCCSSRAQQRGYSQIPRDIGRVRLETLLSYAKPHISVKWMGL